MQYRKGFTLIEFLVVTAIAATIMIFVATFQGNLFSINDFLRESLSIQRDAEVALRNIVSELRAAVSSGVGGYPLEITASTSLAFYSNIDSDALVERVQYYLIGTSLWKSIVKPAGNPLTYSTTTAQETKSVVLTNIISTSTPLFAYYDRNYAGTTSPLAQPVNPLAVRLIRVTFYIDNDPLRLPPPFTFSSQVSIRNLKDN